jgi:hypothetical protein
MTEADRTGSSEAILCVSDNLGVCGRLTRVGISETRFFTGVEEGLVTKDQI